MGILLAVGGFLAGYFANEPERRGGGRGEWRGTQSSVPDASSVSVGASNVQDAKDTKGIKDAQAKESPAPESTPTEIPTNILSVVDERILEARYDAALTLCQEARTNPNASGQLRYRAALCLEGLGDHRQAQAIYRTLIVKDEDDCLSIAAQLGLARTALHLDQAHEARRILSSMHLRGQEPVFKQHPYLADSTYLLAFSMLASLPQPQPPGPLAPTGWARSSPVVYVERFVGWSSPSNGDAAQGQESDQAEAGLTVVRAGSSPMTYRVRGRVENAPILDLLDRLATESGLTSEWTTAARRILDSRRARLALNNAALPEVLFHLTVPHEVRWSLGEGKLQYAAREETPAEQLHAGERERIVRRLRDALVTYPAHPLAPSAYLELGNHSTTLPEAVSWYERLIREKDRSYETVPAHYNLGLAYYRLGSRGLARDAFYRVVDEAVGNELTELASWWIGRLHLDDMAPGEAVRPFRQALAASPPTSAAAALGLAATHLMGNDPQAAHAVIREHRQAISQSPFTPTAAFLDAYTRCTLAGDKGDGAAMRDLIASLPALDIMPVLGHAGTYLQGQACRRLNLGEMMVQLYDEPLGDLKGPLAWEMANENAEWLFQSGRLAEAKSRFESIAALPLPELANRARVRLAWITLQQGRIEECLIYSDRLLKDLPEHRREILTLMAEAYRAKGDYARAAEAMAGR